MSLYNIQIILLCTNYIKKEKKSSTYLTHSICLILILVEFEKYKSEICFTYTNIKYKLNIHKLY